jgi:hypothetical protein
MHNRQWLAPWIVAVVAAGCGGAKDETSTDTEVEPQVETADTAEEILPIPGEDAVLRIVSPENSDEVDPTFQLVWEVEGCDIDSPSRDRGACHIHRYLDGVGLEAPPTDGVGQYTYEAFPVADLTPGEHSVTIVLIPNGKPDADSFDDGPHDTPISATVTFMVLAPPEETDVEDTEVVDTEVDPVDTEVVDTDVDPVDTDVVDTDPGETDSDTDAPGSETGDTFAVAPDTDTDP